ncbi:MAG: gas vesicle protein GvpN [Halobacteria archaeon]
MTSNDEHERKVRGKKIRSDRKEKKERSRDKKRESKEMERIQKKGGSTETSPDSTSTMQDFEIGSSFVETQAVIEFKERLKRWMEANYPIHLIGPTGCGKTSMALNVAKERDRPVVWINGDADLDTSDLVGEYSGKEQYSVQDKYIHNVQKSKQIINDRWVDNPLTIAVEEGATLVYNEFSRTKPAANNVLLSIFEEGVLELPEKHGESRYVEVHPEFRSILISNPIEYAGVHRPQDALLDRLIGIYMDFYDFETEVKIVEDQLNDELPEDVVEKLVTVMRELRENLEINIGTRAAIMAADGLAVYDDFDRDLLGEVCLDVLASKVSKKERLGEIRREVDSIIEETPEADIG